MTALYTDVVQDDYGRPIPDVQVFVLNADGTLAALTNSGGSAIDNPAVTGRDGLFSFFAVPNVYPAEFRYGGVTIRQDSIIVGNPPQYIGPTGPSNNTRVNLTALKAAAITDLTSLYDGSLWSWSTAGAPYTADDVNVVKADSTALNVGAWVRQSPRRSDLSAPTGSALVGFTQSGTGAVTHSVQDELRDRVSVKQFGATGDGTTDDTAAITAALAVAKNVYFPAGSYKITSALTLTTSHVLHGAEADKTFIYGTGSMDVIYVNLTSGNDHGMAIRDMTISNVTPIGSQTSGSGIRLNNAFLARIENVKVLGCYNGLRITNSGLGWVTNFHVLVFSNVGVLIETGNYDFYFNNFIVSGPGTYGIKITDFSDEHTFSNGVVSSATTALYTDSAVYSVSQRPEFCRFTNVSFDTCTNGLDLGNCTDMVFTSCFVSNRPGYGLQLGVRGIVENIQFVGCTFFNNGTHGALVGVGATNLDFMACKFISNSQASVGVSHGLLINGAATDFNVISCTFFNGWGLTTGQNYGLYIANSASTRFVVTGNRFGTSGGSFVNSATGAEQLISGNIGDGARNNGSATYDPSSLVDGAGTTTTVTVTGAALGDFAVASFSGDLQGITLTAWVSAANTVSVRFQNESGGTLDLASGTLRARVMKA